MRVTVGSANQAALQGLQDNASRLQKLQSQLSSGKQITTPSDNPSGAIQALQLRGEVSRNNQYATNATDAIAFMSTADSTYSQIQTLAQNARTLVVKGLNTGTSTGTSNAAIADQIDAIKRSIASLANTTYNGQPIFGGTTGAGTAYAATGTPMYPGGDPAIAYTGDGGTLRRQVGPSTTVTINQSGTAVFGTASSTPTNPTAGNPVDLFQLLTNISAALRGTTGAPPLDGNGTQPAALTQLDDAIGRVSTAQAAEGATYHEVLSAQSAQASTNVTLKSQLSTIQDIDLPSLAVEVSTAQVTYQAALQTTASVKQMSLLNFLN